MAEATDLAQIREQVEAESQEEGGEGQETQFEDGFSFKTVVGALFVGFIMLPGALYLGLMAGQGLGPAAEWVTIVLFAEIMRRAQAEGWNLVALDLGIDLSTPAGEFLASVMASAAQWERRIIGQRTREALAAKKAAGVVLGRPRLLPDPVVARMVDERRSGRTLTAIADGLNDDQVPTAQGGVRWYPGTVRKVLLSASA